MDSYKVVFLGEVVAGYDAGDVKAAFSSKFGISEQAKIDKLFSGKQVTLRKNIDHSSALKLKEKLAAMGAIGHARKMDTSEGSWLSFSEDAKAGQSATSTTTKNNSGHEPVAESHTGLSLVPIAEKEPVDEDAASAEPAGPASFKAQDPAPTSNPATDYTPPEQSTTPASQSPAARVAAAELELNRNTSGDGSSSAPEGASGLCWGGFFLGWIWAAFNRSWLGLLGLVPFLSLPVALVLLFKGRDWAWKNKRWRSVEHFNEVQRKWSIAGMIIAVVGGFLWLQLLRDVAEFSEAEAMQMEQQRQELRDQLDSIEDPEQRKQMEAIIKFQEELQKELEKSQ